MSKSVPRERMTTHEVAESMLDSGRFFTASTLAKTLGIPLDNANNTLYNIKTTKKYQTVTEGKPVAVKVIDIQGKKKPLNELMTTLYNEALDEHNYL